MAGWKATLSNDSSAWLGYGWWDSWRYAHCSIM